MAGFEFEGKVYLLSDKLESRVKDTLLSEINSGVKLFYISELYSKHEDWLFEENVVDQGSGFWQRLYYRSEFCFFFSGIGNVQNKRF